MKASKASIIFCSEKGRLENQSFLLIKSIQKWLDCSQFSVHAYSPRKHNLPSLETIKFYKLNEVTHNTEYLNRKFDDYPVANKMLVCTDFEKNNPNAENIMFLDTDTIFLNKIDLNLMSVDKKLYLRPVDNKGPGSEGIGDINDEFWQQIFKLCGVVLPDPAIWTTVRPGLIRNYFNAGFIWVNKIPGFFQQWYADFMTIIKSELRPFGWTSRDGNDFRCLDQVALAVTATRYQQYLQILPETYNYPIPFRPMMKDRTNHPKFNELTHIHYHKWFQHPGFLDHITTDEDKKTEQYLWLKEQLPLHPIIDEPFKC